MPDGPAEYYLDGAVCGRWLGRAATSLGLAGPVDPEGFRRVLAGRDPATGDMLIGGRAATKGRTPGYDLTISAPKSVSLLAVLSDPAVGDQVREAHRRAVDAAMRLVDVEVATVRRGRDGSRQLPAELVAASFQHYTSRAVDPQLHTHVVVANMGRAGDGRWTALHGQRLYGWAKTAGTLYQAQLRAELTQRLGVGWGPVRNGRAEIEGFTRAQLEAFSTRRAEIAAQLDRVGRSDPRSAQLAAWSTRDPKVEIPEPLLVPRWRARAAGIGLTTEHINSLTRRHPALAPPPQALADDLLGPGGLTVHASSFDRRHALEAIANAHRAGVTVDQAAAAADRLLA
ncbi:MAG TPA: MobF family relaxase, partial [Acidimicrobiales bacterium]|nr:MobF family relaxase [Acidimicrobiales bacterium]